MSLFGCKKWLYGLWIIVSIQGMWERKLYDCVNNMNRKQTSQDTEEGMEVSNN